MSGLGDLLNALTHQALTHQHGMGTGFFHPPGIASAVNAALRNEQGDSRRKRDQLFRRGELGYKTCEITVIDTDHINIELMGTLHLGLIMGFKEDIELPFARFVDTAFDHIVIKNSGDQENSIRREDLCLDHLIGIEHEILAQGRQFAGITGLQKRLWRSSKARPVGQYGQTRRPSLFIGLGNVGGLGVFANPTRGRACPLDLCNQADLAIVRTAAQRIGKRTARRGITRHGRKLIHGELGLQHFNFGTLVADDFFQCIHGLATV
jgi:hypothetical protein